MKALPKGFRADQLLHLGACILIALKEPVCIASRKERGDILRGITERSERLLYALLFGTQVRLSSLKILFMVFIGLFPFYFGLATGYRILPGKCSRKDLSYPRIFQIYSGAVRVKSRHANRMQGAVNSN